MASRGKKAVGEAVRTLLEEVIIDAELPVLSPEQQCAASAAPALLATALTSAELARLHDYNPILAAQLASRSGEDLSPLVRSLLEDWRAAGCPREAEAHAVVPQPAPVSLEEVAREQGEETCAQIGASSKKRLQEQGNLLIWCGYPTTIARVSPFFPMSNAEKGRRDRIVKNLKATLLDKTRCVESACYLINELVSSGPWGEIVYTGPKLSVEEEDALMALLAIIEAGPGRALRGEHAKKSIDISQVDAKTSAIGGESVALPAGAEPVSDLGKVSLSDRDNTPQSFTYKGPLLPILRLMGHKRPGTNHYIKLVTSLRCLALGSMQLFVREDGADTQYDLSQILSNLRLKPQAHEISVTINPFFYQMYLANSLTWIDITKRFEIRGSIAKALYRFCQSHRENPVFRGNVLTLTQALNMDPETPLKETRRQIRDAISELVTRKVLEKSSTLMRNNLVILNRTAEALPARKKALRTGRART